MAIVGPCNVSVLDSSENTSVIVRGSEDPRSIHYKHFFDFGETERERIREIFREWNDNIMRNNTPSISHTDNNLKREWLGKTEQGRVRSIREWVQINNQQSHACADGREEQDAHSEHVQTKHDRRGFRRLCGRQALLDMLKKAEVERRKEINGLLEQRAVSHFAHSNRIQLLLKIRFLRNDRLAEGERPTSPAEGELGLLRQRNTVSGLREVLFSRFENLVKDHAKSNNSEFATTSDSELNGYLTEQYEASSFWLPDVQHSEQPMHIKERSNSEESVSSISLLNVRSDLEEWQEGFSLNDEGDSQQLENIETLQRRDDSGQNVDRFMGGGTLQAQAEEHTNTHDNEVFSTQWEPSNEEIDRHGLSDLTHDFDNAIPEYREDAHLPEAPEGRDEHGRFQDITPVELLNQETFPAQRLGEVNFPDNNNVYDTEITDLLNRRTVSNLLNSDFRDSLNQLIQSYMERQNLTDDSREPDGVESSPESPEHMERRLNEERITVEFQTVNDLRIDMDRILQRMANLQSMLEACMDMQLQLQQSIRRH